MTNMQAKAIVHMVVGVGQIVSGVVTATGHGVVGKICRDTGCMSRAFVLGKLSVDGGKARFAKGMREWQATRHS